MTADSPTEPESPGDGDENAPDSLIGQVVDGRYRVERLLGEGGMGSVYAAEHLSLRKEVALKLIHPQFIGNGEVAARFAREAMASARLEHPNVASALDYGTLPEGGAYLVMPLVRGRSLEEAREEGPTDWRRACDVGIQISGALRAAHKNGIIHRDLKPDNVLMEDLEDGSVQVKVLDFGIARIASDDPVALSGAEPTKALTRVGTVMGTVGYMAPEQAMGDTVDERIDLYALGIVLWEMVTGKRLYDSKDITGVVTRQLTETPERLSTAADSSIPEAFDTLVAKLMSRDPEERPHSAAEVRNALRRLASRSAPPRQPAAKAPAQDLGTARTERPEGRAVTLLRKRGILLAGGAVTAVLVLSLALMGLEGQGADKTDAELPTESMLERLIPGPPAAVTEHIELMVEGSRRERKPAAQWLRDYKTPDAIPEWALAVAELETERRCRDRKEAVIRLAEIDDDDALGVLERWAKKGKTGCGFLSLSDCQGCLREELDHTIAVLKGED